VLRRQGRPEGVRARRPPPDALAPASRARRELTEEGQLWLQHVSSIPATRLDVITLQERLDQLLQQRQVGRTAASRLCAVPLARVCSRAEA
jgi:dynein light intermediate chain